MKYSVDVLIFHDEYSYLFIYLFIYYAQGSIKQHTPNTVK